MQIKVFLGLSLFVLLVINNNFAMDDSPINPAPKMTPSGPPNTPNPNKQENSDEESKKIQEKAKANTIVLTLPNAKIKSSSKKDKTTKESDKA